MAVSSNTVFAGFTAQLFARLQGGDGRHGARTEDAIGLADRIAEPDERLLQLEDRAARLALFQYAVRGWIQASRRPVANGFPLVELLFAIG